MRLRFFTMLAMGCLAACGDDGGGDAASVDAAISIDAGENDAELSLSASEDEIRLRHGESVDIAVEVSRSGFSGAVEVSAVNLPAGLSVEALSLSEGSNTGTLTVSATSSAATGGLQISLSAQSAEEPELQATASQELFVAGAIGALDTGFGEGGEILFKPTKLNSNFAQSLGLDSEGRILVGGLGQAGLAADAWIVRILSDGEVDDGFDTIGNFTLEDNTSSSLMGLLVLSDDSMLALIRSFGGQDVRYLRKMNSDGSVDTDFGNQGDTQTGNSLTRLTAHGADFLVSASGRIEKYQADGTADGDFAFVRDFPPGMRSLMSKGDAFLIGGAEHSEFLIAQRLASGAADTSFGDKGLLLVPLPEGRSEGAIQDIQVNADGSGIALAVTQVGATADENQLLLLRFSEGGVLDTSFGDNGVVSVFASEEVGGGRQLRILPDGKILVVAYVFDNGINAVLRRFMPDGSVDTSFGDNGSLSLVSLPRQIMIEPGVGRVVLATQGSEGRVRLVRRWL